jgi:hypothetical protein
MRKPTCADVTHTRKPGTRRCVTCQTARQRQQRARRRAAQGEVLLMAEGVTAHQAGALRMWERRRQTYGPSGASPDAVARNVEHAATLAQRRRRRTACVNGHALTIANVEITAHGRTCRICRAHRLEQRRMRRRGPDYRPTWAETQGGRVNVAVHDAWCQQTGAGLWAEMRAAHPDVGGTAAQFRDARKRWTRFLAQETAWYAAAGVPMPDVKRDTVAREQAA